MLDLIYAIQAKLSAEGISIDHILATGIALVVLVIVGNLNINEQTKEI